MPSKKSGTTESPRHSLKPGQADAKRAPGRRSARPAAAAPRTKRGGNAGRSSPPDHGFVKIVEWSPEDGCYVGSTPPLVGRCCHGDNEADVFRQLCAIVEDWLEIHRREGRPLPTSLVGRRFSGKFQLRLGPDLHRLLALRAASADRSINDLAVEAIEKQLSAG
jgi:predicted HicB family RNase H-like nuclease